VDAEFEAWLISCGGNIDADTMRCMRTAWDAATERAAKIAEIFRDDDPFISDHARHGNLIVRGIAMRIRGGQP
jgi:hypothetical protein